MKEIDPHDIFPPTDLPRKWNRLQGKYRLKWVEGTVKISSGEETESDASSGYVGISFTQKKKLYFFAVITIFFLIVITRLFYLQIIKGSEYRQAAEWNRQRIIAVPAERGLVYDRNMRSLTKNIPSFSIGVIPQDLPRNEDEYHSVISKLAESLEINVDYITSEIEEYGGYKRDAIIIAEDVDYETALLVKIMSTSLPGVYVHHGSKRLYIHDLNEESWSKNIDSLNTSMSHVLGYIGKLNPEELEIKYDEGYLPSDRIGKTGIEKIYEQYLRGIYGQRRIEVDAFGRQQKVIAEEQNFPGSHIRLSIDKLMQDNLERIIKEHLKGTTLQKAAAVVMNPSNGEILSMVGLPAYNNNDFSGGIDVEPYNKYINDEDRPLFNRAIGGTYPSGSLIKPALAAAGLQEGIITQNTSIKSVGGIQVSRWFFPDWMEGGHGATNVRSSIAWSVNTFYYYLGGGYADFVGLGVEKIASYLKQFGLSQKLGIDLLGEQSGMIPTPEWKQEYKGERWYIGDTYNLSIGQGDLLVTPLQMASLTATIANGGILYRPRVVSSIINPITEEENSLSSDVIRSNFIDSSHIHTVQLGMRDCVVYGSCRRLSLLPFSSAGKTGTAQWSSVKENHAWFTSYAPFENPEIVVTILVEEGGGGASTAAPIAYDFYLWWYSYNKGM